MASTLRPAVLDRLGLVPALRQALEEFSEDHGLRGQFVALNLDGVRVPADVETAIYRIVQDGLGNVVQHAQASVSVLQSCDLMGR